MVHNGIEEDRLYPRDVASQQWAEEVQGGFEEALARARPSQGLERFLGTLHQILLEKFRDPGVGGGIADESGHVEVQHEASGVEVGAPRRTEIVVEHPGLAVQDRRQVLPDARARGQEIRKKGAPREPRPRKIGAPGDQQSHVHPAVDGGAQRRLDHRVGDEVGVVIQIRSRVRVRARKKASWVRMCVESGPPATTAQTTPRSPRPKPEASHRGGGGCACRPG